MLVCMLWVAMAAPQGAPDEVGIVKYYRPGLMAQVARNRANPRHWGYVEGFRVRRDVVGYASRPSCATIGQVFWASLNGGVPVPLQQVDCSAPRDRARHLRTGLVVEVGYNVAKRFGFVRAGKAPARIWE